MPVVMILYLTSGIPAWTKASEGIDHNNDTILSYEGVVITPMDISIMAYDAGRGGYGYRAKIQLSPIAFPDQWEDLKFKHRLKKIFHDFFMLFK